jgi:hypothetical protein
MIKIDVFFISIRILVSYLVPKVGYLFNYKSIPALTQLISPMAKNNHANTILHKAINTLWIFSLSDSATRLQYDPQLASAAYIYSHSMMYIICWCFRASRSGA